MSKPIRYTIYATFYVVILLLSTSAAWLAAGGQLRASCGSLWGC